MPNIQFTQYLRPDGRRSLQWIDFPQELVDKANRITSEGYEFEMELLANGVVSFTIADKNNDCDVAIELSSNGPEVNTKIPKLINDFYEKMEKQSEE